MITIFYYAPTPDELEAIGFNSPASREACKFAGDTMTAEDYIDLVPYEQAIYDLAILHELRGLSALKF